MHSSERSALARVGAVLVLVGVAFALVAQFAMDRLADQSDFWHWTQHGLLFWSGLAVGVGALMLFQRGQRPA